MRGRSRTRGPPRALALAAGNRRIGCSYDFESPSSEALPDTPSSFDGISDIPATRFLTIWSRTRALTGSNQARWTKSILLAPARAVLPQFTRPAVSSGLAGTQHGPNGTRHSGDCPKARRERQCSLRSNCRSLGRHWCAKIHEHPLCFLASSAPASAVTGPVTIDAVAGDLRTSSHLHQQKHSRTCCLRGI